VCWIYNKLIFTPYFTRLFELFDKNLIALTVTKIKKIITHGGQWHADEISAIALFAIMHGLELSGILGEVVSLHKPRMYVSLERRINVTNEELEDPSVLVLDIGRKLNYGKSNLDHHQDSILGASNLLMMNYLWDLQKDERVFGKLQKLLFNRISDIDTGVVPRGGESWEFNAIIRACDNFAQALELAVGVISRMIRNIEKSFVDAKLFNALPVIGRVAVNNDTNIILDWKELASAKNIVYLVTPNPRGGFNLISRDSEAFPIKATDNQTFRHNSGFMAVYATQKEAILAGNQN